MSDVILFTLIVGLASLYGILPKSRKIQVQASRGGLPLLVSILGFLVLLASLVGQKWLSYKSISVIEAYNIAFTGFWINVTPMFSALFILTIFVLLTKREKPKPRRDSHLSTKMKELYKNEDYDVLSDIIYTFYDYLIDHPAKPRRPTKIRTIVEATIEIDQEDTEDENPEVSRKERLRIKLKHLKKLIEYYFNSFIYKIRTTAEESASNTQRFLLSNDFGTESSLIKPEIGIKVIKDESLETFPRKDFVHHYLTSLLKSENSLLYRELYDYEGQGLLENLFFDLDSGKKLSPTSPIGSAVIEVLRDRKKLETDNYNDYVNSDNHESEEYREPIQCGIKFFDKAVNKTLDQELKGDIWISYYKSFTKLICENYEITEFSSPENEFPNYYSRLLYEMTDNLTSWIEHVKDVEDEEQDYVQIDDRMGGLTIPQDSVNVLFKCHKEIMTCHEIPTKFKKTISELIFMTLVDLRQYEQESLQREYSDFMISKMEEIMNDNAHYRVNFVNEVYPDLRFQPISNRDREVTGLLDELDELFDYEDDRA